MAWWWPQQQKDLPAFLTKRCWLELPLKGAPSRRSSLKTCHWHALAPRHAVLEWMWENAEGSGEGRCHPVPSASPREGGAGLVLRARNPPFFLTVAGRLDTIRIWQIGQEKKGENHVQSATGHVSGGGRSRQLQQGGGAVVHLPARCDQADQSAGEQPGGATVHPHPSRVGSHRGRALSGPGRPVCRAVLQRLRHPCQKCRWPGTGSASHWHIPHDAGPGAGGPVAQDSGGLSRR